MLMQPEAARMELIPAAQLLNAVDAAEWDDLAQAASEPNPFFERWFVAASLTHLPHTKQLHFAAMRRGGTLCGLMPLSLSSHYGRLPLVHIRNHFHHNVFLGTPLVRKGMEGEYWHSLMTALDSAPWATGLVCFEGLVESGPVCAALTEIERRCDTIYRHERAFLQSDLSSEAYYEATVRKKKRKEIKRLQSRLAELGQVSCRTVNDPAQTDSVCDMFLALERSGWKGKSGGALANDASGDAFFRALVRDGLAQGRVEILLFSLDDRPLAMLVNFMMLPASFSFKIAYDEEFARYSPGVLIQLENLKLLERGGFGWMDSCAAPDHPMINHFWGERRTIVWKALPLRGAKGALSFRFARGAEKIWDVTKAALGKSQADSTPAPEAD